jgi:PBP1b-binding outer membrane lipoprotein LpoB
MKRVSFFLFLTFILTACSSALPPTSQPTTAPEPETPAKKSDLPELGAAPELTNTTWLNVAAPLRLANLRGQVVLIDMWTFG